MSKKEITSPKCRNERSPHVIHVKPDRFSAVRQTKHQTDNDIMKYALLVHETPELVARRKDEALTAAGRAYGEALQAAGVFIGGAGLESSETATTVFVRDGKRHVHDGPYPETKEFLAGFAIIEVPNLAARGHLLQILNRKDEARKAFTRAASLTDDSALRSYLFERSSANT
jgi:hypothetical protein